MTNSRALNGKWAFVGGLTVAAGIALGAVSVSSLAAQESKLRIIQTNSAGDNIHIIDAVTNKVVGEIKGIEAPHGLVVAPDGKRIYVSEEADKTLVVLDGKTLKVIKRIPLSGNPNLIDITPDGRWIYAAIALTWDDLSEFPQIRANASGGVDVIDTVALENVKTIPLRGGIHDLNVTPDGKYVLAGASRGAKPAANAMYVIDTRTNEVAWTLSMSPSPSPMAVTKHPDGSTDKDLRPIGRLQRICGRRLCNAGEDQSDQASRPIARQAEPVRAARRIARHRSHRGSEDAAGQQPAQ